MKEVYPIYCKKATQQKEVEKKQASKDSESTVKGGGAVSFAAFSGLHIFAGHNVRDDPP